MKKSYLKRLICLGAAAFVLCSALAVAAVTGSPYETLKNAVFNGIDIKNGTIKMEMTATLDGEPVADANQSVTQYIGNDSEMSAYKDGSFSFRSGEYSVNNWGGYTDGESWYTAYGGDGIHYTSSYYGIPSPTQDMSPAERRFVELFADLLVGDLKNNISMYERDGVRYITGTLAEMQIPELVDAACDLIASRSTAYLDESDYESYRDDVFPPLEKLRITYVHGDAQVDGDGNLIAISGEARASYTDIFGRERELEISAGIEITDIGTTEPVCPIPGVKELLDEYRQERANYSNIRFKLSEDGTIDRDSVFDMMD